MTIWKKSVCKAQKHAMCQVLLIVLAGSLSIASSKKRSTKKPSASHKFNQSALDARWRNAVELVRRAGIPIRSNPMPIASCSFEYPTHSQMRTETHYCYKRVNAVRPRFRRMYGNYIRASFRGKVHKYIWIVVLEPGANMKTRPSSSNMSGYRYINSARTVAIMRKVGSPASINKNAMYVWGSGVVQVGAFEERISGTAPNSIDFTKNDIRAGRMFGIGLGDSFRKLKTTIGYFSVQSKRLRAGPCYLASIGSYRLFKSLGIMNNKSKLSLRGGRDFRISLRVRDNKVAWISFGLTLPRRVSFNQFASIISRKLGRPKSRGRASYTWKRGDVKVSLWASKSERGIYRNIRLSMNSVSDKVYCDRKRREKRRRF